MRLRDSLMIGLRALSIHRMRSMLTTLGIIIGVAARQYGVGWLGCA
jgi:hypothetical protein